MDSLVIFEKFQMKNVEVKTQKFYLIVRKNFPILEASHKESTFKRNFVWIVISEYFPLVKTVAQASALSAMGSKDRLAARRTLGSDEEMLDQV